MFPPGLFSKKTSLYTHWNLPLVLKLLKAGPAANLAAPLPVHPRFPCTNSSFSLPCARGPLAPLPAADLQEDCFASVCFQSHPFPTGTPKKNTKATSPWPHAGRLQAGQMWSRSDPGATEPFWSHRLPKQIRGAIGQGLLAPGLWAQARTHHGHAPSKLDLTHIQAADPGLSGCTQRSHWKDWGPADTAVLTQHSTPTVF